MPSEKAQGFSSTTSLSTHSRARAQQTQDITLPVEKPRFAVRRRSWFTKNLAVPMATLLISLLRRRRSKKLRRFISIFGLIAIIFISLTIFLAKTNPLIFGRLISLKENHQKYADNPRQLDRITLLPVQDDFKMASEAEVAEEEKVRTLMRESYNATLLRNKYQGKDMSVVVLFHNEYDSLNYALDSWIKNGLITYTQEILFFLNGVKSEEEFRQRVPAVENQIPNTKRRVVVSPENLALGLAITKMVELAKHDYVLLLEKDWELIENKETVDSRLGDSKVLVGSGAAHLVRHRHRHKPGVPLHALIMHQGREESIFRQQKNLLCFVHHWQKDPPNQYPGRGIMYRCGSIENGIVEKNIFCSSSVYCQWTNNPCLFKKNWFINEVGNKFKEHYEIEKGKYGLKSPFLDFEYYTNWRPHAWTDKNFTVAVGTGLFSHAETEHQYFNTFWYAQYRLQVDMEEIRTQYLTNETKLKRQNGAHYDTTGPEPLTMMERYPVEFARKFHFPETFTGTVEQQRQMINKYYTKFQDEYRILSKEEWGRLGRNSAKAKKRVNWRRGITDLHHIVEKAAMIAPPAQPHEMSITLVTCVLDIERNSLGADPYKFNRDFNMYINAMAKWLTHKYPKVVYTSKEIADKLLQNMTADATRTTKFIYTSREELRTRWLGPDNYDRVQEIRKTKSWLERASWLQNSPQAGLSDYNPLVMSKLFMTRDAARHNYWGTTHFVFLDSKHNCQRPDIMNHKNDHILRAHMLNKFLMTTFDYTPANEVHGFEYSAFNRFINFKTPQERNLVKVGRGGIFGGSAFVLEYITAMYDVALTATLRDNLMGTEENIFSILRYQVHQYVDDFSNNWACPQMLKGDHTCKGKKTQGYNCAIFDWMARNAVRDT